MVRLTKFGLLVALPLALLMLTQWAMSWGEYEVVRLLGLLLFYIFILEWAGIFRGKQGKSGLPGKQGKPGKNGNDGIQGLPGRNAAGNPGTPVNAVGNPHNPVRYRGV